MLVTELFSHCCAGTSNKQKNKENGMRRLDEVPSISIAFRLCFHPTCDSGKQGLCVTPQPNLSWEECKSPGLQISEAAQLSGTGRR